MLSKRSLSALIASDSQALRSQWLRSGRCARCFHLSLRRSAEEDSTKDATTSDKNDQGTPLNVPKRGPTRHQRSAMVSQEVQMLQRDRPDPTFNNPQPNTLRPEGAGKTVNPEAVGLNVGSGRMGENDASIQEGPLRNQGVNMNTRKDVDAGADTRAAKSTGQPFTVESAAERGWSGLERGLGGSTGERLTRPPEEDDEDDEEEDEEGEEDEDDVPDAWTKQPREAALRDLVQPEAVSKNKLLRSKSGPTIAALNFEAVIDDRLTSIAELGDSNMQTRRQTPLALKLMSGRLVQFESKEEKAAVLETAKTSFKHKTPFAPLPENVQQALVDKMVAGKYGNEGVWNSDIKQKHAVLDRVANATMMNGTYLASDGERFLRKVKELLPATSTATTGQQRQKGKATV